MNREAAYRITDQLNDGADVIALTDVLDALHEMARDEVAVGESRATVASLAASALEQLVHDLGISARDAEVEL